MSYVKKINGYAIKDEEARRDIETIKSGVTGAMHWLGKSSNEIVEGSRTGKWTIDGKDYTSEYIDIVLGVEEHSPTVRYFRDDTLEDGYEFPDDPARMIGFRAESTQGDPIPNTVYIHTSNLQEIEIYNVYIKGENYSWTSYNSILSGATVSLYHSPANQNAYLLKNGYVAAYLKKEFVWSFSGWTEFGDLGSLKALAFKDTATVNASGTCTPQGTNEASAVTFSNPGALPEMQYDPENETLTFIQGSFPSGGVAAAQVFRGSNTDVSVSGTAS